MIMWSGIGLRHKEEKKMKHYLAQDIKTGNWLVINSNNEVVDYFNMISDAQMRAKSLNRSDAA